MPSNIDELIAKLPQVIGLGRYAPSRQNFSFRDFDPTRVRDTDDLPPYLVLGILDRSNCHFSGDGWSARWQGREVNTHFDITYKAKEKEYAICQTWCGTDGGAAIYPASLPIGQIITQALYMKFPSSWEKRAKEILEDEFQLTYVGHQGDMASFCGIPDGAFRVISFPVAAERLKTVFDVLSRTSKTLALPYPFYAYARPIFQVINFREGLAADWTADPSAVFDKSVRDTGLIPHGIPIREVAPDGSAAWTLRRVTYVVVLNLPFAGLTDFLERLESADGPVRRRNRSSMGFDVQPIIFPSGLEEQSQSLVYWDREQTTRSLWLLRGDEGPDIRQQLSAVEQSHSSSSSLIRIVEDVSRKQLELLANALKDGRRK